MLNGQTGIPAVTGADLRERFVRNLPGNVATIRFEGMRSIPYITDRPPPNEPGHNHPRYDRSAVIGGLRRGGGE